MGTCSAEPPPWFCVWTWEPSLLCCPITAQRNGSSPRPPDTWFLGLSGGEEESRHPAEFCPCRKAVPRGTCPLSPGLSIAGDGRGGRTQRRHCRLGGPSSWLYQPLPQRASSHGSLWKVNQQQEESPGCLLTSVNSSPHRLPRRLVAGDQTEFSISSLNPLWG